MPNNDSNATEDEPHHSKTTRSHSTTESWSSGPMAAAARLMSSLRPSRGTGASSESTDATNPSASLKTNRKRFSSTGERSTSPKTPISAPSMGTTSSPFNPSPSSAIHNSSTAPSNLNQNSDVESPDSDLPTPETVDPSFNFDAIQNQLRDLAESNCRYFSQQKSDVCRRFERLLLQLLHAIELSIPLIRYITDNFYRFDYSPEVTHLVFLPIHSVQHAYRSRYEPVATEHW